MVDGTSQETPRTPLDLDGAAAALLAEFPVDLWDDGQEDASEPKPAKKPVPKDEPAVQATSEEAEPAEEETTDEVVADDEEAEEDAVDAPKTFRLKIGDEEIEVTEDELPKGYLRQRDYTQKTMQLAEERKSFQVEAEAVRVERAKYAENLKQLEEVIKSQTPAEPDWDKLRAELEPGEFAAHWAMWDRHRAQIAQLQQEREKAEAKVAEDNTRAKQERLQTEGVKLLEAIPEWKNPEVKKARQAAITTYAVEALGATPEQVAQIDNHKLIVLLDKAERFDALQKAKPKVQQTIQSVKAATPGNTQAKKPVSDITRAKQRHAKTGSIEDAAAVLMLMDS